MGSVNWREGMLPDARETEAKLTKIVDKMREQLLNWDESYEIKLLEELLETDIYYIVVQGETKHYKVTLPRKTVSVLQQTSDIALEQHIWRVLRQQGLAMKTSNGTNPS